MRSSQHQERGSFRRRLTLTFVLVAAVSTGTLAVVSFLLVQQDRSNSFVERSLDKAQLATSVAEARLSTQPSDEELRSLIETLGRRAGMEVWLRSGGRSYSSISGLAADLLLEALPPTADQDGLRSVPVELEDHHYLVVSPTELTDPELLFLFSRDNLIQQMQRLSTLLWRLWLGLGLMAALVGNVVARRTLRPIARAGEAAISLAEGILATRLPIDRRDEFGAWALSFNRMAGALEDKIRELEEAAERERRFTSDVAHELRTPISALVTAAEMLMAAEAEMGPEAAWAAERLSSQVKRLRGLVEELLEISRFDARREQLNLTQVDLPDLITRLLRHHAWTDRVEATVEDCSIVTDPRRVDRIVVNLISNSIEHGAGVIKLHARLQDSEVVVQVEDEGPGIDAGDASRIFDRFYKADPSRAGGSGLGLSIARENARLLGGDVTLTSSSEATVFTARFPRKADFNGDEASPRV